MQVKQKRAKETGHNPEKQENKKDTDLPPGGGETKRYELCGSLTLLQS
jgi:hypothetical protein